MVRRWMLVPLMLSVFAAVLPAAGAATAVSTNSDTVTIAAQEPAVTPLTEEFMGMVVRDPHYEWKTNPAYSGSNKAFYEEMGKNLAAIGVKWVRIELFAEEFAPQEGEADLRGRVNIEKYRYFIDEVAPKYNFKVLALLATPLVRQRPTGDLAYFTDDPNADPQETYGPGAYIHPENLEDPLAINTGSQLGYVNAYMRIWLENAMAVAQAFPYDPTTGKGIAAYEVLNEENRYLLGGGKGLSPEFVGTLLTKFYRAFRQTYPTSQAKIILGGLHPDRCDDCRKADGTLGMNDRQYLDAIYKSGAFTTYRNSPTQGNGKYPLDGVGYHPYAAEMRSGLVPEDTSFYDLFRVASRMDRMRDVMVFNGDTNNKFWITEFGDRGAPITVDPAGDNERRQATFMREMYRILWQRRSYVENVFWFKYEDFAVPSDATKVGTENWGVVRLQPRPASQACPQPVPVDRQTCEYEQNGTVQRFKLSYATYKEIAERGFQYYMTRLPSVRQLRGQ